MRMLGAEMLKIRRRWASFVVLILLLAFMGISYVLVGISTHGRGGATAARIFLHFPSSYGVMNLFIYGLLGSLLAVAYAGTIAGGDWNWGIFRLVVARGESRSRYVLIKFLSIGIALFIGVLVIYAVGVVLTFVAGGLASVDVGGPIGSGSGGELFRSIYLGFPVLLERAAIGLTIAVVMRSQVAGVVVGIVFYIGETILTLLLTGITFASSIDQFGNRIDPGVQWFQFLPFSIGTEVLNNTTQLAGQNVGRLGSAFLDPVPLETALVVLAVYLVIAVGVAVLSVERSQVTS